MRTIGAKGKPKYISVSLAELNQKFHPNALIQINEKYSILFQQAPSPEAVTSVNLEKAKEEIIEEIEFKIS